MRILHIIDKIGIAGSPIHGPSRLLLALWPELEASGTELALCILRSRTEAAAEFDAVGIKTSFLGRGKLDPRTLSDLIGIIRQGEFDAVHLHGYGATTFGRLAASFCGVPSIVHEHMVDDKMPAYQKLADRLLSRQCDAGIAVSDSVKEFMVGGRYLRKDIIEVIPNTVAIRYEDRQSIGTSEGLRSSLAIPQECRLVGAVGRLHPVKGLTFLIASFTKVLKTIPDAHLLLVGEGDERQQLEAQVVSSGLTDNVHFTGHQENVRPYLAAFDVLVLSSLSEGCPLSLLEGMAFGIPVVATRVGGIPEVITHEQSGLLVEAQDIDSIAQGIISCLSDKANAALLSEGARKEFQQRFAPEVVADQYLNIYKHVTGIKQ